MKKDISALIEHSLAMPSNSWKKFQSLAAIGEAVIKNHALNKELDSPKELNSKLDCKTALNSKLDSLRGNI